MFYSFILFNREKVCGISNSRFSEFNSSDITTLRKDAWNKAASESIMVSQTFEIRTMFTAENIWRGCWKGKDFLGKPDFLNTEKKNHLKSFPLKILSEMKPTIIINRKFKQWWSTIPPISTKQTIISHFNSLNTKIPRCMMYA